MPDLQESPSSLRLQEHQQSQRVRNTSIIYLPPKKHIYYLRVHDRLLNPELLVDTLKAKGQPSDFRQPVRHRLPHSHTTLILV